MIVVTSIMIIVVIVFLTLVCLIMFPSWSSLWEWGCVHDLCHWFAIGCHQRLRHLCPDQLESQTSEERCRCWWRSPGQSYKGRAGSLGTGRTASRRPTFSSQGSPIFHLSSLDKACENGRLSSCPMGHWPFFSRLGPQFPGSNLTSKLARHQHIIIWNSWERIGNNKKRIVGQICLFSPESKNLLVLVAKLSCLLLQTLKLSSSWWNCTAAIKAPRMGTANIGCIKRSCLWSSEKTHVYENQL